MEPKKMPSLGNAEEAGCCTPKSEPKYSSENNSLQTEAAAVTTTTVNINDRIPHQQRQQQQRSVQQLAPIVDNVDGSALIYLQKYGYMSAPTGGVETNNLVSEESFSGAVAEFQQFAGLPQTGIVDNLTLHYMQLPRCGNSDKWQPAKIDTHQDQPSLQHEQNRSLAPLHAANSAGFSTTLQRTAGGGSLRKKRYALQGSKWRRQELTYRISQYPTRFNGKRHEVDGQIERAFSIWSRVAPIDFVVKREGRVHIDIRFASGDHGDGDPFDGPGNTLAHAYFPQYGGDAHFDDQEYWTIDSYTGTNIFQVAAHELGHSLGLGHSNVREALMAPFYQKYKPHFKLHTDDILAVQALYGEKPDVGFPESSIYSSQPKPTSTTTSLPSTSTTTTTTTTPPPPAITTTTTTSSPQTRFSRFPFYKGGHKPHSATGGTQSPPLAAGDGTTREVNDTDDQSNIDRNTHNSIPDLSTNGIGGGDEGQPPITQSGNGGAGPPFANMPADLCLDSAIDAATRTEDGSSYVFKGDFYWLLTSEGLARGYPRRISLDWEGLPGHLDAALTWADGKTFFFKGNKYWRFKNKRRDLGYPKLISAGFAGIPNDIDAALVWSGNGRTYIFKGAQYWRFDSKAEPPVSSEYPRSIKVWSGVPAHLNAAFKWENNVTYFFKGNQYYRFNDKEFRVESRGRPPFPRLSSDWWFGCVSSNLAQRALPPLRNQITFRTNQIWPTAINGEMSDYYRQYQHNQNNHQHHQHQNSGQNDPGDWSLLAGADSDQSRSLGTHISDTHKPPPIQPNNSSVDDTMTTNEPGGTQQINHMDTNSLPPINRRVGKDLGGSRISLHDLQHNRAASSSSSSVTSAIPPFPLAGSCLSCQVALKLCISVLAVIFLERQLIATR